MIDRSTDQPLPPGKLPAELLSRLLRQYGSHDPSVLVGPSAGYDAAALSLGGAVLVVKTDPVTFATADAARYLVDINVNDLACLGATPRWMLVTALLPEGKTTAADVEYQFQQLHTVCAEHRISLVGGHTEITLGLDRPILVGQLLGEAPTDRLLRPGGAQPGDRLLLTKPIAIEGTALLARELRDRLEPILGAALLDRAANLLNDPGISVRRDASVLLDAGGVTALHDPTEGGLATGVYEIAAAAGLGAFVNLDVVPVRPETTAIAGVLDLDPLGMLASGSLLATAPAAAVETLISAGDAAGLDIAVIGKITAAERGYTLISQQGTGPLPRYDRDEVSRALGLA